MRKLLLLGMAVFVVSCSKEEEDCTFGKITGISNVQDQGYITLDNGRKIPIAVSKLILYNIGDCYEGTK